MYERYEIRHLEVLYITDKFRFATEHSKPNFPRSNCFRRTPSFSRWFTTLTTVTGQQKLVYIPGQQMVHEVFFCHTIFIIVFPRLYGTVATFFSILKILYWTVLYDYNIGVKYNNVEIITKLQNVVHNMYRHAHKSIIYSVYPRFNFEQILYILEYMGPHNFKHAR